MPLIRTPLYTTLDGPRVPQPLNAYRELAQQRLQGIMQDDVELPAREDNAELPAREKERDGYLEKLIKYVPGEVVAAFGGIVAASAAASEDVNVRYTLGYQSKGHVCHSNHPLS